MQRQIVVDTETTGLSPSDGHRIIEIGALELVNRRLTGKRLHCYLKPDVKISEGALRVHGITEKFLADKPLFAEIADELLAFLHDAELIIHNAPFDMGFFDYEFHLLGRQPLSDSSSVIDTLSFARQKHPGQKNNLDALCKRYNIDNSHRQLHGALLDAEILTEVYLAMTGGQESLSLSVAHETTHVQQQHKNITNKTISDVPLSVILANDQEQTDHQSYLEKMHKDSGKVPLWLREET
jgi:DNA polymerase-3 subunit epsilon